MKSKSLMFILIALVLIISIYFLFQNQKKEISRVCLENKCFNVEIARTESEHEKGLMYRESLPENQGMLFIFDKSDNYQFWMKNTLISLDIIWIDENLNVAAIKTAVPCTKDPCEIYNPEKSALYVLEINSGQVEKNQIKVGSKVEFLHN